MTTGKGDLAWALSWYRRTWPYKKLLFWGFEPGQVHGILGPRQKTSPEKEALPHDHKNRRPARHRRLCEIPCHHRHLPGAGLCVHRRGEHSLTLRPQWRAHPSGERPPLRGRHSLWQAHRHDRRGHRHGAV